MTEQAMTEYGTVFQTFVDWWWHGFAFQLIWYFLIYPTGLSKLLTWWRG